jgi:mannose-6-phosphate isomerase
LPTDATVGLADAGDLRACHASLQHWLTHAALPLWASRGVDAVHGGFHELLAPEGPLVAAPRRARVQVRQIYAFARAAGMGWQGDAERLVTRGWDYFFRHYRRTDGLYRTLVAADGAVLDERALLYDQAFVLLALAETRRFLGPVPELDTVAHSLRLEICRRFKGSGPGFAEQGDGGLLLPNAHMHLLEAAQSWISVGDEAAWQELATEIVALALDQLIDAGTGALVEQAGGSWQAPPDSLAAHVEPGHQYEWAWLLLRWRGARHAQAAAAAVRLVQAGERHGIRGGVAVMALDEQFNLRDGTARLWAQTERLKAALAMARWTGQRDYVVTAVQTVAALSRYLRGDAPGLWWDQVSAAGELVHEPAPASTLYHLVGAIGELGAALEHT